jgi:hypothetical protein
MCAMNNKRNSTHNIFLLMMILISLCIGIHFLHDLQPGHSDIFGSSTGVCTGIIHYGIIISFIPSAFFVGLLFNYSLFYILFPRVNKNSIFIPPPIH